MTSDNALELRGVSKRYRGFTLKDVSFTLPRGARSAPAALSARSPSTM